MNFFEFNSGGVIPGSEDFLMSFIIWKLSSGRYLPEGFLRELFPEDLSGVLSCLRIDQIFMPCTLFPEIFFRGFTPEAIFLVGFSEFPPV